MSRRRMPNNGSLGLIAAGLFFLSGWLIWDQNRAISNARTTPGVVTGVRIVVRRKKYVPVVEYRYHVAGRSFTGRRLEPRIWGYFSKGEAEGHLRPYSRGQKVSVHYSPEKPDTAFLEARVNYQPPVLSLAVGLLALAALVHNLASKRYKLTGGSEGFGPAQSDRNSRE